MTKVLALILACLALGVVVAGCGGDDEDGGGDSQNTEQPAETSGGDGGGDGGAAAGGGTEIGMSNIQFDPAEVTVDAGATITFVNNEAIPHDVHKTAGPGADFASGPPGGMQEGDTFELTLDEAGSYEYVCEVHAPGMAGTITVR